MIIPPSIDIILDSSVSIWPVFNSWTYVISAWISLVFIPPASKETKETDDFGSNIVRFVKYKLF